MDIADFFPDHQQQQNHHGQNGEHHSDAVHPCLHLIFKISVVIHLGCSIRKINVIDREFRRIRPHKRHRDIICISVNGRIIGIASVHLNADYHIGMFSHPQIHLCRIGGSQPVLRHIFLKIRYCTDILRLQYILLRPG